MLIKTNVELTINVEEDDFKTEKVEIQRKNRFKSLKKAVKTMITDEFDDLFDKVKVKSIKVQFDNENLQ